MGRVTQKVAVITGAGTGVGRACMKLFAAEGAKVVGVSRTQLNLDETLRQLRAAGGEGMILARDLATDSAAEEVVQAALQAYGRVDILVHAAGVGYSWMQQSPDSMNDVANTPPDKWREVIRINLDSFYLASRAVIPHMKAQGGGAIVAVASISGLQGLAVAHAYTASKGGTINLTRSLCVAYAKDNIRANCIAPGFIDTPMVASVINLFDDPDMADRLTPMRRPGTAEEMAYGCLYLASDEASYCNGTVLVIDGGTTARQ
jgi:NAD(P)-dependent dehydrogenase (short-subunit alcohol dehydrogenase family)